MAVNWDKILAAEKRLNWRDLKAVEKFLILLVKESGRMSEGRAQSTIMRLLAFDHPQRSVDALMLRMHKVIGDRTVTA